MNPSTGSTQLFHPRGPLCTLPLPADPAEAFAFVGRCLDAGWLVTAPGLEHGEQREEVGYVLRGSCENNGEVTPTLLLYSTNEAHRFSFLKIYLDRPEDVTAFEHAAKLRLTDLPQYEGNDKPERARSSKTDRYIVRVKTPFGVVLRDNPKFNEADRAAAQARNEIYKVPRRLFIRWAPDQAAPTSPQPARNGAGQAGGPPTPQPKPAPSTASTETPVQKAVRAMTACTALANLDQWATWAKNIAGRSSADDELLQATYTQNRARLTAKKGAAAQS